MKENTASNIIHLPVRPSADKFIKLDPRFLPLCKYTKSAIFISYLIGLSEYWSKRLGANCFYCTRAQQQKALRLSRFELEKSERECLEKGWIKKKKMGIPAKNHYYIDFKEIYRSLGELKKPKNRRKPSVLHCIANKSTTLYSEQVNHSCVAHSLKEIDIRNLSLNPTGEERERDRNNGDSSERSEQRADLGIAALGATLPHPPVEDAKRRPEPLPAAPPPLRHADFNRFLAYLNASHPIVVGYLKKHCDLDKVRYERGHVEIPLLPIVENEIDGVLIKAIKSNILRERAAGTLESCAQRVRDVLKEDGTRWVVTFVDQEPANV